MSSMETLKPLLQRVIAITRNHVRDVELAVMGTVTPEGPLVVSGENTPPKKQQVQTCTVVCMKWGEFPQNDEEIRRMIVNWSLLPESLRIPALVDLMCKAPEDLMGEEMSKSSPNYELVQAVMDVVIADWVNGCLALRQVRDPELAAAIEERALVQPQLPSSMQQQPVSSSIMVKFLARRLDSNTPSSPWWWSALILRLRSLASLRWSQALKKLSGPSADEFILQRLTPLGTSSGGGSNAAVIAWCGFDLLPEDVSSTHLPALLLQAFSNAEDDTVKELVLDSLRVVLERADLVSTPDASRIGHKAIVLAEGALKSKEIKDSALRVVGTLFVKTLGDNFDLIMDKFVQKRILRALSSADPKKIARAIDLANVLLANAVSPVVQKKLAVLFSVEVFEKPKYGKGVRTGTWSLEDSQYARLAHLICLADPSVGIGKTLPVLLSDEEFGSRKNAIGLSALRLVLSEPLLTTLIDVSYVEKLYDLVQRSVVPCLVALAHSSAAPSQAYEWSSFIEQEYCGRSLTTSAYHFANYLAQPNQAELKGKCVLRKLLEEETENVFGEADKLVQRFVADGIVLDPSTLTRIMAISQGLECLLVARNMTASQLLQRNRNARMIQLPPLQFLDRSLHHPAVRAICLSSLEQIASHPQFSEKLSVIKALRDQVVDSMDFVDELIACIRVGSKRHAQLQSSDIVRDIGIGLDALALALVIAGNVKGADELAEAAEWSHFSPNRAANAIRSERNIVKLVCNMPPQVQQEVMRVVSIWSSLGRKSREVAWALSTRGTSIFVACDAARANLEEVCWNPNLKRGTNQSTDYNLLALLDVAGAADCQEVSAVNVLTRVIQWWRTGASASAAGTGMSHALAPTYSTSKKSFSVLRRLTASQNSGAMVSHSSASMASVPSMGSSFSSTSTTTNGGNPQAGAEESTTTTEEDEILLRVVRKVVESRQALRNSLKTHGNRSPVLRCVREALAIFATPMSAAQSRKRTVSQRFAIDLFFVTSALCEELGHWMDEEEDIGAMTYAQACKVADEAWARAERRKLWVLLRRIAGYADVPSLPVTQSDPSQSQLLTQEVVRGSVNLLKIGPVSLGQVADAPDRDMWRWIMREHSIADWYLIAHFSSLLPCYFTRAFPSVTADNSVVATPTKDFDLLLSSILRAVRFHFSADFAAGVSTKTVLEERIPRALILATALMCPPRKLTEGDLGDLLLAALVSSLDQSEPFLEEILGMLNMFKREDDEARRANISKICARVCPELSEEVTELLWDRCCFRLSEPWAATVPPSFLERAYRCGAPGQVWKSFLDEQTVLRFLVRKLEEEEESTEKKNAPEPAAVDLLRHVARKAACGNLVSVLLPLLDPSPQDTSVITTYASPLVLGAVYNALLERGTELLAYCAADEEEAFTRLAVVALASSSTTINTRSMVREFVRFLRTVCGLNAEDLQVELDKLRLVEDTEEDFQALGEDALIVIVGLKKANEQLCRGLLDEILRRIARANNVERFLSPSATFSLRLQGEKMQLPQQLFTMSNLMRLYRKLRAVGVRPRRFSMRAEALALLSSGPLGSSCLAALTKAIEDDAEDDVAVLEDRQKTLEQILDVTLSYLAERWTAEGSPAVERLVLALMRQKRAGSTTAVYPVTSGVAFWAGLERLLRVALVSRMTALTEMRRADCFAILEGLALRQGEEDLAAALRLFGNNPGRCGETALLMLFDVALEVGSDEWIALALEASSAGPTLAQRALKDVLCDSRFHASPAVAEAAAALVARTQRADDQDQSQVAMSVNRYRGRVDEDIALARSERLWTEGASKLAATLGQDHLPPGDMRSRSSGGGDGSQKRRSFITVRKRTARAADVIGEQLSTTRLASLSPMGNGGESSRYSNMSLANTTANTNATSASTASGSSPGLKKPRKPIVDIREALADPTARVRLLAHVADRGIDPSLVLALEHYPHVPGLDREDLWQSFQRSRWWLFEDDMSNLFT